MVYSPLEQFKIFNFLFFSNYNVSLFFIFFLFFLISEKNSAIIPCFIFQKIEIIFWTFFELSKSNIKKYNNFYFFLILLVFFFLLFCNLFGMLPYSFTVTSQVLLVFFISLFLFLSINIFSIFKYGIKFFKLFLLFFRIKYIKKCHKDARREALCSKLY
ncbi:F0F1 ATP synthase subunit A, partial [Arcobacter sp.]|uniref:F0F1 ATP synthase subunit A n=1 Tax=Arcobacter sp. TaxID=1872629 RepID=UPI003D0F2119